MSFGINSGRWGFTGGGSGGGGGTITGANEGLTVDGTVISMGGGEAEPGVFTSERLFEGDFFWSWQDSISAPAFAMNIGPRLFDLTTPSDGRAFRAISGGFSFLRNSPVSADTLNFLPSGLENVFQTGIWKENSSAQPFGMYFNVAANSDANQWLTLTDDAEQTFDPDNLYTDPNNPMVIMDVWNTSNVSSGFEVVSRFNGVMPAFIARSLGSSPLASNGSAFRTYGATDDDYTDFFHGFGAATPYDGANISSTGNIGIQSPGQIVLGGSGITGSTYLQIDNFNNSYLFENTANTGLIESRGNDFYLLRSSSDGPPVFRIGSFDGNQGSASFLYDDLNQRLVLSAEDNSNPAENYFILDIPNRTVDFPNTVNIQESLVYGGGTGSYVFGPSSGAKPAVVVGLDNTQYLELSDGNNTYNVGLILL